MRQIIRIPAIFLYISAIIFTLFIAAEIHAQEHRDWEQVMREFDQLDSTASYPDDLVFFTGSSSIRLWETLRDDMKPYTVINRGFGGSRIPDLLHYADRYISRHSFSAMVLFVANDITGNPVIDKSPEEVADLFEQFIRKIRGYNSEAPVFIIEITPTARRWDAWPQISWLNGLLASLCDENHNVIFIPTSDLFLDRNDLPIDHLFLDDRLHLNSTGYEVWSKRIRSYIDPVLENRIR